MPGSQEHQQAYYRNFGRKSPPYRFNGEEMRSKADLIDDRVLLHLFKDQDGESGGQEEGKVLQPLQQEHGWQDINGCNLQNSTSFSSNPYLGGPNITPPFTMTGELMEAKRRHQDSSSSSESECSQGSQPRADSLCRSGGVRLNKDEKLARENGIQLSIKQDIVDPPMDEFNDMLSKEDLSEEQLNICRDIRRRGKNKVAAQNCRKRKLEQIDELQKKVEDARQRRHQLRREHEQLLNVYVSEVETLTRLTDSVLTHQGKDPHFYSVVVKGEEVKVLPTEQVPEADRFPKPIEHFRVRQTPAEDQYHNNGMMYGQHQHQHHQHHSGYMDLNRTWD